MQRLFMNQIIEYGKIHKFSLTFIDMRQKIYIGNPFKNTFGLFCFCPFPVLTVVTLVASCISNRAAAHFLMAATLPSLKNFENQ